MTLASLRRTRIICTLGPATDAPGVVAALVESGMDIARVNLAHGTHGEHAARIVRVREAARIAARPLAVLADLPGPKFRIGSLSHGTLHLEPGMVVFLGSAPQTPDCLPVRHPELLHALKSDESVYLSDGTVELRVRYVSADRVACEVVAGGFVRSGSGINIPETQLPALIPTGEDRRHLEFAVSQKVEWIGVSFVQTAVDVAHVRTSLPLGTAPLVVAKIEKRRALENLEEIVRAADAVMVARGDLGVETDLAAMAITQKRIIRVANASGRPVITATQMLESMVERDSPTRAEVTDVANAVLDGSDAVMLSAETAVGRHPAAAVKVLERVIEATERDMRCDAAKRSPADDNDEGDDAIGLAACRLAQQVNAKAIIVRTTAPKAIASLSRFRPRIPIVALANAPGEGKALLMLSGVVPFHASGVSVESQVKRALQRLIELGYATHEDRAVVVDAASDGNRAGEMLRSIALTAP